MRSRIVIVALVAAVALCGAVSAARPVGVVHQGIDIWKTAADGRTFSDFTHRPIPAGFFCAGSEPFASRIVFRGSPLATGEAGELGAADTVVQRLDDAVFSKRGVASTRVQVRALSLVAVEPIRTACGSFDAKVLLDGEQPVTRMSILRQSANGGVYIANLALNIKILFTPVGRPSARPIELKQSIRFTRNPASPWTVAEPETVRAAFVSVDTDGDGRAETTLPGLSSFAAGKGGGTDKILNRDCHQYYDPVEGYSCWHCVGQADPR